MDFAKNLLNKYGWKDGDGLGKDKQGIKKPIKANLKFDSSGLGASHDSDIGNNWWDRCFNDAAQNVKVEKEQNGQVILDLKDAEDSVEVSTKGYSVKKLKSSGSGVYGNNFLPSDVAVSSFEMKKYRVLTDEELFQACGGRTAHKGARHGLKLSGKLARIEQQEKELLAKMQQSKAKNSKIKESANHETRQEDNLEETSNVLADNSCQLTKKKKKRKIKDETSESNASSKDELAHNCPKETQEKIDSLDENQAKKKKKKKRKDIEASNQ